ncbi:unnamed protein product [Pelagomonas calceolata]|uniref:Uncharacterized protein n=1 Tax=Pelagomonas calceolata TaxID=35677 RepID=A0A8J2SLY1_9STRA|nr:unnamed protein product [Pelagomonas calceolata]
MADAAREDRERLGKRRLAEFIAECEEASDLAAELSELEALKKFFAAFDALITNRDVKATWEMIERLPVDVGPPGTTLRDCYRKARGLIDAGSDSA